MGETQGRTLDIDGVDIWERGVGKAYSAPKFIPVTVSFLKDHWLQCMEWSGKEGIQKSKSKSCVSNPTGAGFD